MKYARWLLNYAYHRCVKQDDLYANLKFFNKSEYWSAADLQELQRQKLIRLIEHSRSHVPYYQKIIENQGMDLCSGDIPALLSHFPLLDKALIRKERENMYARNREDFRVQKSSTSGSTGESLYFLLDHRRRAATSACHFFHLEWCGVSPFDKAATLWGASFDDRPVKSLQDRLRAFSRPLLFLSSYQLDDGMMAGYVKQLKAWKPKILTSYPSPLEQFALYCKDNHFRFPSLQAIICSAEQLFDHQRDLFAEVFGVPVFNRYGCREFGDVAHECEKHRGLHIASQRVIIEILDEDGRRCPPGKTGELVITDLDNYIMPFIRYRIGDLARWSDSSGCECGRKFPLLEAVEGRAFDMVKTPGGKRISGTFWTLLMRNVSEQIESFQIVQSEEDAIHIFIKTSYTENALPDREEKNLLSEIRTYAPDLSVHIEYVDAVPSTKSGKRRFVISHV